MFPALAVLSSITHNDIIYIQCRKAGKTRKGNDCMELHAKLVRAQLNFFKPFVANCSLEVTRKGQDKLG